MFEFVQFDSRLLVFSWQRMDLGECTKIHDLALRADYEIASKERDLFFELDVSKTSFKHVNKSTELV